MRLRALLWPTLLAGAASCGRIDFDAQPGLDGGTPVIDAGPPSDMGNVPPIDAGIDPDLLWWDPAWSHRVRVSFDTTALEELPDFEALVDIPLAVRIEESGLDPATLQPGAGDVRFVAPDNKTELAYEIELRPTSDANDVIGSGAVFWVKVPSIRRGDLRNYVWLYYGNPDAADAQRPADVWTADYVAVWHLGERELERRDSTRSGHHLLGEGQLGSAEDGDLLLGDSVALTPNDPKPLQHPPILDPATAPLAFTVEAFVHPDSSENDMMIAASSDGDAARSFELRRAAVGEAIEFSISLDCTSVITAVYDSDPVDVGRWHHIVATYDGHTLRVFHNGFLTTELPVVVANEYPVCPAQAPFTLGALDTQVLQFSGRMDEMRVSSRAQPPAWIKAQFLAARGELIAYDAPEPRP